MLAGCTQKRQALHALLKPPAKSPCWERAFWRGLLHLKKTLMYKAQTAFCLLESVPSMDLRSMGGEDKVNSIFIEFVYNNLVLSC
jgi:hypothetical protein